MIQTDPAMGEGEVAMAGPYLQELEEAQFRLLTASELHQEQRLQAAVEKAEMEGLGSGKS